MHQRFGKAFLGKEAGLLQPLQARRCHRPLARKGQAYAQVPGDYAHVKRDI
jgi:hypothetical protein